MNDSKTEWIELVLFDKVKERGVEPRRNIKAPGSLLGDHQDVHRRMQQAAIAFRRMMTLWFQKQKVSESRRIRLYKAYILPNLTYNIGLYDEQRSKQTRCLSLETALLFYWCLLPKSYIQYCPLQSLPSRAHFSYCPTCLLATIWPHIEATCLSSSQQGNDGLLQ